MTWRDRAACQTCTEEGRKGYCARLRCYCGHEDCHASASYVEVLPPDVTTIPTSKSRAAELWADREEPTWLDR